MKLIEKRKRVWGNDYGRTHRGWRLYVLGVPVWRWRHRVDRSQAEAQNGAEGNHREARSSPAILQDC